MHRNLEKLNVRIISNNMSTNAELEVIRSDVETSPGAGGGLHCDSEDWLN